MSVAKELYEFQQVDSQIEARKGRLAQIQANLADDAQVVAAQAELQAMSQRLRTLESDQRSLEWEVEETQSRIASLEARMYGNQVVNPRDLKSVDAEIGHLRERQTAQEDRVLALMEAAEEARPGVKAQEGNVQTLEARWAETQRELLRERQRLEEEVPQWEEKRRQDAASLDEPAVRLYERLRATKGGLAVARVEGGACTGCRIALPVSLVQRAPTEKQFAYCNSCGRILYVH